jgi:VanZ family protein
MIFYFSSLSKLPIHYTFNNEDKCFHFAEYAILGIIFYFNFRGGHSKIFRIFIALLILSYPVLDEWHQSFVPGRDPSVFDAMTDYFGITLGFITLRYFFGGRNEKNIRDGKNS